MILRILLLLIYFNLSSSEREYNIDMDRCIVDMKCFIRESCIKGKTGAASDMKLVPYISTSAQLNDFCSVIMQIKSYTDSKWQVRIQINASTSQNDIADSGVSFIQGGADTDVQFKCDKTKVEAGPSFKITIMGQNRYNDKTLFCAFTLEIKDKSVFSFYAKDIDHKPKLVFKTDQDQTVEYPDEKAKFWKKASNDDNCDPEKITSEKDQTTQSDAEYIFHVLDSTLKWPLKCESSKNLRIHMLGSQPEVLEKNAEINCRSADWIHTLTNGAEKKLKQKFTAHCVEKFCTLCPALGNLDCGPGCTNSAKEEVADKCPSVTCPATNGFWQLDGGKEVSGELECKKDGNTINAAWFFKGGVHSDKVEKAACFNKEICWTTANLVEDCPPEPEKIPGFPEDMECVKQQLAKATNNSELSCPDGHELKWIPPSGNELKNSSKITCEFATGKFKDGGHEVAPKSRVICLRKKEVVKKEDEPAAAGLKTEYYVGIGGGIGAVVLIIAIVVIVVLVKRRKEDERQRKPKPKLGDSLHSIEAPSQISQQSVAQPAPEEAPKSDGVIPTLPKTAKGPWQSRDKQGEETWTKALKPADFFTTKFTEKGFITQCLADFNILEDVWRREIFYHIFSLAAHNARKEQRPPYGQVRHAFELVKRMQVCQHDTHQNMSRAWRFIKLLGFLLQSRAKDKIQAKLLCKRLRMIMATWARPILTDLGWKTQPNEDRKDAELRWWAVRVLVWAGGQQDVMTELKRQYELPIEQLETPMRAIVLAYAARNMNQVETIHTNYWKDKVEANPLDPKTDQYGTIRQHLLFALAMASSAGKKYEEVNEDFSVGEGDEDFVKEFLPKVYEFDTKKKLHFTPFDLLWAIQGASEHSANAKAAIEVHTEQLNKMRKAMQEKAATDKLDDAMTYTVSPLYQQLVAANPKKDPDVRNAFLQAFVDANEVLADICPEKKLWEDLSEVTNYHEQRLCLGWAKDLPTQSIGLKFDTYNKRVECQEDLFKDPKVITTLSEAMKCCE